MKFSNKDLQAGVLSGDMRSISRLISLCENKVPRAAAVLSALYPHGGNAHVIGVTGSPGAGKSTLVDQLAADWHAAGKKVAVIAVDPSSPFSGGAVLGDRIRMNRAAQCEEIFIRSLASRGALGGISRATVDAVQILDAAGFDRIIVETVGVGQGEVDIMRTAESCVLVLVPGMGDSVQSMKAGVMEIADIFTINKADHPGVDNLHKDIRMLISLAGYSGDSWEPPIHKTVATKGEGISELAGSIDEHARWLQSSSRGAAHRERVIRQRVLGIISDLVFDQVLGHSSVDLDGIVEKCLNRRSDPYTEAAAVLDYFKNPEEPN